MKKIYKIVPFDVELAKKIQAGEIEGRILTKDGKKVRIICWNRDSVFPIVALVQQSIYGGGENTISYSITGKENLTRESTNDLFIELPEEALMHKFKPFDKVLVRQSDKADWRVALYSHFNPEENLHVTAWLDWYQCIPYEGNEYLVGTSDKPKED